MRGPSLAVGVVAVLVAFAGCFGVGDPFLEPRPSTYDSAASFTVEDVSPNFQYQDLTLLVNGVPYEHGPRMSTQERFFAVEDKSRPNELIHAEDRIWLPAAGRIDVVFEHNPPRTPVKELRLIVEDTRAPPPPTLVEPGDGTRQASLPLLNWTPVDDPSGVSYLIELQASPPPQTPGLGGPDAQETQEPVRLTGFQVHEHQLGPGDGLLPGLTYTWRVQAIDGLGHTSPWSKPASFTLTG